MAKKKVTRKELLNAPDEFITFSGKLLKIMATYKVQLLYAVGLLILIGIIFSGISYFSYRSEGQAFAMLEKTMKNYEVSLKKNGSEKAFKEIKNDFIKIIDKYSGNSGGKIARIEFANISINSGDTAGAIDLYRKALEDFSDNQTVKNIILSNLGYAYEEKNDLKSAVKYFEMIVSEPDTFLKDEALFNLGRIYAAMGNEKMSRDAYKKIVSEFAGSFYLAIAKERS
ncbi:MAG: tetratricopeptide repeat protein [Proteobacteria bacterium]|nr:tetratricopeptide repeat protein [Pseudomonadota bacterium]